MLTSSKEILEEARRYKYAVPSANFVDEDSLRCHVETAEELGLPIIIALAESHLDQLTGLEEAAEMARYYGAKTGVPVVLHLDHGESVEMTKKAVDLGFTSVMLDASMDPFEENVRKTKEVIAYAHTHGASVEAEIGHVGTGALYDNDSDNQYTTAAEAARFVQETGVDSLAVSIGTAHGMYSGTPKINFERLHELAEAVPVPLVLHGGSSSGDDNLHRCATEGIAKINIYSDFMAAASDAMKKVIGYADHGAVQAYYDYKNAARDAMKACLRHYYKVFSTEKRGF